MYKIRIKRLEIENTKQGIKYINNYSILLH